MDLVAAVQSGDDRILSTLPPDVLFDIVTRLDYQDILRLCRVSHIFNDLFCREDNSLWRFLYQRDISRIRRPASGNYQQAYRKIMDFLRGKNLGKTNDWSRPLRMAMSNW